MLDARYDGEMPLTVSGRWWYEGEMSLVMKGRCRSPVLLAHAEENALFWIALHLHFSSTTGSGSQLCLNIYNLVYSSESLELGLLKACIFIYQHSTICSKKTSLQTKQGPFFCAQPTVRTSCLRITISLIIKLVTTRGGRLFTV